jgi:hypothetical protein
LKRLRNKPRKNLIEKNLKIKIKLKQMKKKEDHNQLKKKLKKN